MEICKRSYTASVSARNENVQRVRAHLSSAPISCEFLEGRTLYLHSDSTKVKVIEKRFLFGSRFRTGRGQSERERVREKERERAG